MKYSPSPWKYKETDDGDILVVMDEAHDVLIGNLEGSCGICHANAHLISAAPELLEALKYLAEWITDNQTSIEGEIIIDDLLQDTRIAISKAKGEST